MNLNGRMISKWMNNMNLNGRMINKWMNDMTKLTNHQ